MLAELAAANAAYSVIKNSLKNGGELYELGQHLASYFDNSSKIEKRAMNNGRSDIEAFFAREKLREQETELQELFIYQGRGGLWQDWLEFKRDAKKARDQEEKRLRLKRAKTKRLIIQWIYISLITIAIAFLIGLVGYLALAIRTRTI